MGRVACSRPSGGTPWARMSRERGARGGRWAMQTRVAPTPSGFLHVGNAANALLTSAWAMDEGLELRLRIDDLDDARARPEYIEDILELLDWLGIRWTHGPRTVEECQEARAARSTSTAAAL